MDKFFYAAVSGPFYTILTTVLFAILSPEKIGLKVILAAIVPFRIWILLVLYSLFLLVFLDAVFGYIY